jgi:integrase
VAKAYRLMSAIMALAVDDEVIVRNPCRIKGAGAENTPDQRTVTVEEVDSIARAIDPRYSVLVLVGAFIGLRWGEAVGLRRDCIDLAGGFLRVVEQVTQPGNAAFVVGPPKTESSIRTCNIPHLLIP